MRESSFTYYIFHSWIFQLGSLCEGDTFVTVNSPPPPKLRLALLIILPFSFVFPSFYFSFVSLWGTPYTSMLFSFSTHCVRFCKYAFCLIIHLISEQHETNRQYYMHTPRYWCVHILLEDHFSDPDTLLTFYRHCRNHKNKFCVVFNIFVWDKGIT